MNDPDTRDPLERILREALHADAERAPQLPMEWIGPPPFVDGTDHVAALGGRSTTVTLIDTETTPAQPESRHRWSIMALAAAVVAIGVGVVVLAARDDSSEQIPAGPPTIVAQPTTVAQPATVSQPPVEFTACIDPGPTVHSGPEEQVVVPSSDGAMTLVQYRGDTFRQGWTEVSDPRLEGTYTRSWNEDTYLHPGGEEDPSIVVVTDRIENDEGAWQGSSVWLRTPGPSAYAPLVLVGEGAYEGLTAILGGVETYGECAVSGYIIDGAIPATPVPPSGQ